MVGYISSLSLEPSYRNRLALGDDKKVRASEQSARREKEKGWKGRERRERQKDLRMERKRKGRKREKVVVKDSKTE